MKMQLMVAEQSFSRRLVRALDHAGIPGGRERRLAVAKLFGVSREAVRKWLADESLPDQKRVVAIARKLGVRTEWLLSGSGPMVEASEPLPAKSAMPAKSAAGVRQIWNLANEGQLSSEDVSLLVQVANRLAGK